VTASREKESLVYEDGNGRKAAVLWMEILSVMHEERNELRIHLEGKNPGLIT
jgi:predicted transcriptional regulator